ncbi:hypothetical protein A2U01_0052113 [Trifolium medium]|uniref:Uncharacterized protein n=1 Tax=Trifolium medium TaxID=97028 RepID=A0A392R474_9FABA|nr:hypothetical protein [Trifolium medium]
MNNTNGRTAAAPSPENDLEQSAAKEAPAAASTTPNGVQGGDARSLRTTKARGYISENRFGLEEQSGGGRWFLV